MATSTTWPLWPHGFMAHQYEVKVPLGAEFARLGRRFREFGL
ncbi:MULTISPECIES: hypothetical protein [Streptomyces]|nr:MULTISPECIES: hypothetical protein [Streptomyces]